MSLTRSAFVVAAMALAAGSAKGAQWCVGNVCANGVVLEDCLGN